MSDANKKLKLLLFGTVGAKIPALVNKIKTLHKSKAGPFDVCFCVGSFQVPAEGSSDYQLLETLPIPVYVQDALVARHNPDLESNEEIQTIVEPHLKAFPSTKANIYNISAPSKPDVNLVVASCPSHLRMDSSEQVKPLMEKLSHVSYVGCDLLLTSHWPQGMETLDASIAQQAQLRSTYDVAEVALRARARYHVVPSDTSLNQYWQSPPFFHLAGTTSTHAPQHTGRLVALGHVSEDKKVPKQNKFVHALGLVPLHYMDVSELQQSLGQGVAPCPFTDESYGRDAPLSSSSSNAAIVRGNQTPAGLSEAQARRILAEGNASNQQRWNLPNNRNNNNSNNPKKRNASKQQEDDEYQEVDPSNMTLFIHGLHKDVSGQLQQASDITLLQAFQPYGCQKVRHPPNAATSSFAFLEFDTHDEAKLCLETLGGETTVAGVHLTLKWATHGNKKSSLYKQHIDGPSHKRPRLTEEEAKDSSTLYYRLPSRILSQDYAQVSEQVRKWMEHTLEEALSEGGNRITAEEEPALQVQLRYTEPHPYGFLDFASHAAASMAIATLTGSTNGGIVQSDDGEEKEEANGVKDMKKDQAEPENVKKEENNLKKEDREVDEPKVKKEDVGADEPKIKKEEEPNNTASSDFKKEENDAVTPDSSLKKLWGLVLHWAHAKIEKSDKPKDVIQDADCNFQFQRQHFPPDSRQDCWFCLASEGCEKHLITGVYELCYSAMPKGPIHKGHVLVIPVAHSSQGAFMDKTVCQEVQEIQKALRQHASEQYDMDLFVFERAIQTKGGYHTHVQCVPIPKGLGIKLETNLRAQAKANHFELREIQSPDLVLSSLFGGDDGDDDGYFYCEVPVAGSKLEFKRFLYKVQSQSGGNGRRPHVPLQFGREVVAATLGKKELAHWKSCQLEKEEEAKMAREFRESFERFYG